MRSIDEDNNLLIIDPPDTFRNCTRGMYTLTKECKDMLILPIDCH